MRTMLLIPADSALSVGMEGHLLQSGEAEAPRGR